ncbi:alpha/beta hydrolase [Streptomyces sp. NHF165]|uniref:alpha/beta hydrolase n=1 Tax=Streptomyces sp. NHF165 TaxID=2175864 RepID=UPI00132F3E75|nr:alpha/beta hydrolase [Streptomyces sp. NHF165]QHF96085.1 alpha/beta hydrolase [Streptomyces sp. NHF165]
MTEPSPAPPAGPPDPDPLGPRARHIVDAQAAAFPELGPGTDVAQARRATSAADPDGPAVASVTERRIPGPAGAPELPVRIYRPDGSPAPPVVVFLHGGGFVLCDLDTHDTMCRNLALGSGAVVVSVDYRRAPEHRAPAAAEDAYAALCWAAAELAPAGPPAGRIAVAGDSAGGALAAAACLLARERGGPMPAAQLLLYPSLDPRLETRSMRTYGEGFFVRAAHLRWYWQQYLGSDVPPHRAPPVAAPALAEDLSGLPPARVLVPGCDPLADEGRAFAARLPSAELDEVPGGFHGFLAFTKLLPEAADAMERCTGWLRERLARTA